MPRLLVNKNDSRGTQAFRIAALSPRLTLATASYAVEVYAQLHYTVYYNELYDGLTLTEMAIYGRQSALLGISAFRYWYLAYHFAERGDTRCFISNM